MTIRRPVKCGRGLAAIGPMVVIALIYTVAYTLANCSRRVERWAHDSADRLDSWARADGKQLKGG